MAFSEKMLYNRNYEVHHTVPDYRVFNITLQENEYSLIELLTFPESPLFLQADHGWDSPGLPFLLRYHRISQIERLMVRVNYCRMEYRSIRTIPDMALKKLLQNYHTVLGLRPAGNRRVFHAEDRAAAA